MSSPILRFVAPLIAAGVVVTTPVPALAQDSVSEARLRKIEAEVRALQRRVFPGGDGRFFEPQIDSGSSSASTASNPASTTAVTDILARLDAIELQMQRLTAGTEVNTNSISALDMRLRALEGTGASSETSNGTPISTAPVSASTSAPVISTPAAVAPTPAPAPAATGPSAERLAGVQAITKPQTDDAGDDEYSYGYRLWNAGYYPEAQQQLSKFVDQYPSHWRTTFGRNLLGRAYLDNNQPREAAPWFLRNYQSDKQAARAGDSLLFLAETMIALDDTSRACIALAEFGETYPALASGRLSDKYESNRRKVSC